MAISIVIVAVFLFIYTADSFAASVAIKGDMKIQRMGGYVILINYETRDSWTDNVVFKVHCEFEKGKSTFMSASLDNVKRGWHKTQVPISKNLRKRYGYLKGYRIDLYENGILIDTKKSY